MFTLRGRGMLSILAQGWRAGCWPRDLRGGRALQGRPHIATRLLGHPRETYRRFGVAMRTTDDRPTRAPRRWCAPRCLRRPSSA